MSRTIKVEMPYGIVTIRNKKEAARFILESCNNCNFSNIMQTCSGKQSQECYEEKKKVIAAYQ
ncbi:MAG: hypothetical protein IJT36_01610 [Alphaproteobacteria bacterium]|nr:hypothetical protein [Alphaproteobacteria bacterium]